MRLRIYCLLAVLWLVTACYSQSPPNIIRPLTIGDTMPDITLINVYNYPVSKIQLSDLKGKLVLLDFWATWCGSCIESFPKLSALQEKFGSSLQTLLINIETQDDDRKVNSFLEKRKARSGYEMNLPYSLHDTVLKELFPFKFIPHIAWINAERKVIAITDKSDVTIENIHSAIQGKSFDFTFKNDGLAYSPSAALKTDSFLFRSIVTSSYPELGSSFGTKGDKSGNVTKLFAVNTSLYSLMQMAWPSVLKYPLNRTLVKKRNLNLNGIYCYEIIMPPVSQVKAREYMQDDLIRYFNIKVGLENRPIDCYVLNINSRNKLPKSLGGTTATDIDRTSLRKYMRNGEIDFLTYFLSTLLNVPVLNESGYNEKIDINFPANIYELNFSELRQFLSTIGFSVTKQKRNLEITVIQSN